MMRYWLEEFMAVGAIVLGVFILVGLVLAAAGIGIYALNRWQCAEYENVTGKATRYVALSCYVETESGWQQWDEYRTRAIASEGLKAE